VGIDGNGAKFDDEDPEVMKPQTLILEINGNPALESGQTIYASKTLDTYPSSSSGKEMLPM